jgi:hypothetical protein
VKLAQVADMEFFRTYGRLWSREREEDLNGFHKIRRKPLLDGLGTDQKL